MDLVEVLFKLKVRICSDETFVLLMLLLLIREDRVAVEDPVAVEDMLLSWSRAVAVSEVRSRRPEWSKSSFEENGTLEPSEEDEEKERVGWMGRDRCCRRSTRRSSICCW